MNNYFLGIIWETKESSHRHRWLLFYFMALAAEKPNTSAWSIEL